VTDLISNPDPQLLAFCPEFFPLLSTNLTLVGHTSKFCKAAFYLITHSVNGFRNVRSKGDDKRRQQWDRLALLHADRIHGSTDDGTHSALLNSVGLDSCDAAAFASGPCALAVLLGVSRIAGALYTLP
jgi:hypothetical protein